MIEQIVTEGKKKKPPPAIAKGREKPAVPPCFSPDGAALLLARIAARGIRFNAGGGTLPCRFSPETPILNLRRILRRALPAASPVLWSGCRPLTHVCSSFEGIIPDCTGFVKGDIEETGGRGITFLRLRLSLPPATPRSIS